MYKFKIYVLIPHSYLRKFPCEKSSSKSIFVWLNYLSYCCIESFNECVWYFSYLKWGFANFSGTYLIVGGCVWGQMGQFESRLVFFNKPTTPAISHKFFRLKRFRSGLKCFSLDLLLNYPHCPHQRGLPKRGLWGGKGGGGRALGLCPLNAIKTHFNFNNGYTQQKLTFRSINIAWFS